jgi:uncharacterized membrane protein
MAPDEQESKASGRCSMKLGVSVIDTPPQIAETGRQAMPDALLILSLATALSAGLVAGVFFAFSTFVMAALGRLPAHEGIRAMQEINVTVINPWFMTALFGTAPASIAAAIAALADWDGSYGGYLIAAAVLYVVGCVFVTMVFNVPRNNELAALEPTSAEAPRVWERYLSEWTAWNTVRMLASLAASGALIGGIAAG